MHRFFFNKPANQSLLICLWLTWILDLYLLNNTVLGESPSSKPNILFLFADDLSYEAVGYAKRYRIETPNLDELASRGIVFSQTYNMGSFSPAVCVASRTMLVTGRSVWRTEALFKNVEKVRDAQELWPQLLKKAGYSTYLTGKWHVPLDAKTCFDQTGTVRGGMPNDKSRWYSRPIEGQPDTWNPSDESLGGYWTGGKHWSEVTANEACGFIESAKDSSQPFFAYVAFNAPHDPRQSPQAYLDRYPLDTITLPESYADNYPWADQIGCGPSLRDERLAPFPRTPFAIRTHRREYFALITHLDAQIGRILQSLKDSGQANNTWIFFTADHGLAIGNHGLLGKQNMYEHSLRVPCIAVGPNMTESRTISERVYLQDIVPTTLALAGIEQPSSHEFKSLLPLIEQGDYQSRPGIYGSYLNLQRAYIKNDFKLVVYPKAKVKRLFNLKQDPLELTDLAQQPKYQQVIEELTLALEEEEKQLRQTQPTHERPRS